MPDTNSQEGAIYRSLASQIQLGFYGGGERFPSAQEIARRYQVSYCPAQRALKSLEQDGLIALCRGRETAVLAKPWADYLKTELFRSRTAALRDLNRSLELISPAVSICGMLHPAVSPPYDEASALPGKRLYRQFDGLLHAMGSRTVLSLYYDIGAFVESAYLDILYEFYSQEAADTFLGTLSSAVRQSMQDCQDGAYAKAEERLDRLAKRFFVSLDQYLTSSPPVGGQEPFVWTPRKGRARYCDVIAVDLICKFHQGVYPVGAPLPTSELLADVYHVSPITMRRTIKLLDQLGVTKTVNGVGTHVISPGDAGIPYKLKDLMMDDNLRSFLEALQLLAITSERVAAYSFPHFSTHALHTISYASSIPGQKASMVSTISACMQAVVRCCPLAAIREIYEKLTHLLLYGSILRLDETGREQVPGWPEISGALLAGLTAGDAAQFAAAFRRTAEKVFFSSKQELLKIGVAGVEEVADPAVI